MASAAIDTIRDRANHRRLDMSSVDISCACTLDGNAPREVGLRDCRKLEDVALRLACNVSSLRAFDLWVARLRAARTCRHAALEHFRLARATGKTLDAEPGVDACVLADLARRIGDFAAAQACCRRRPLPHAAGRSGPPARSEPRGRDGAGVGDRVGSLGLRVAEARAVQRVPLDEHPGRGRARAELRRGDGRDGGDRRAAARRRRLRVDGRLVSGADGAVAGAAPVRLLGARHLPRPRRALRELDGAPVGHARAAARRHRRRGGDGPSRPAERRVLPDRPADRARPDHEERHPDRAVRQGARWTRA